MANPDYFFKILLVGDSSVGKSEVLLRFADDYYTDQILSTIGTDFKIRTIELGGKTIKLQIWDSAGQERFRTISESYYRGVRGVMVMFDLTDRTSFLNIKTWIEEIQRNANENVARVLIGTRLDRVNERVITNNEAQEYADSIGVSYWEVSAKDNFNIENVFYDMVLKILNSIDAQTGPNKTIINPSEAYGATIEIKQGIFKSWKQANVSINRLLMQIFKPKKREALHNIHLPTVLSIEKTDEIFTLKTTQLKLEFKLVDARFLELMIKRGIFFYWWPKRMEIVTKTKEPFNVPMEILKCIFSYLDRKSLARCGKVCSHWYNVSSEAWKRWKTKNGDDPQLMYYLEQIKI